MKLSHIAINSLVTFKKHFERIIKKNPEKIYKFS